MELIPIAIISKPHGVKGAVKVKTESDFKTERYKTGNTLYINYKDKPVEVTVKGFFSQNKVDVLSFEEFDSLNAIEPYLGCTLMIDASTREPLEEDAFYYSDLLGLKVYEETTYVGVVSSIKPLPQGELLIIKREGKKDALVPFQKQFVKSVDDDKITLYYVEGLL